MRRRCLFIGASGSFLARTLQSNLQQKSNYTLVSTSLYKQWYLNLIMCNCILDIYYECLCAFMKNFSNNIKRKDWNSPFLKSFSYDSLENYSFNFTSLYKINRFEIRNTKAKEIFVGLCSGLWIKQNILILSSDIVERFQRFLKRRHWFCILICE